MLAFDQAILDLVSRHLRGAICAVSTKRTRSGTDQYRVLHYAARWTLIVFSAVRSYVAICLFNMPGKTSCITSTYAALTSPKSGELQLLDAASSLIRGTRQRALIHCRSRCLETALGEIDRAGFHRPRTEMSPCPRRNVVLPGAAETKRFPDRFRSAQASGHPRRGSWAGMSFTREKIRRRSKRSALVTRRV